MTAATFAAGWFRIPSRPGHIVRFCEVDTTSPGRANWIAAYLTRDLAGDPSRAEFLLPMAQFQNLKAVRIETETAA